MQCIYVLHNDFFHLIDLILDHVDPVATVQQVSMQIFKTIMLLGQTHLKQKKCVKASSINKMINISSHFGCLGNKVDEKWMVDEDYQ